MPAGYKEKKDDNIRQNKVDLGKIIKKNTYSLDEKKRIFEKIENLRSVLEREMKKRDIDADAVVGGSSAKGTFLKGDFDCDIFARFSKDYRDTKKPLPDILENVIKALSKDHERVHGSRDYFKLRKGRIDYEIIPVMKIKRPEEAFNITDFSPLHVEWIKKKIRKYPRLVDEIILTKVFMKSQDIYGAESYIKGFSGHVVDILVANYGSFLNLLKSAVSWKKHQVIDVEKHHKNSKEVFSVLNRSKISPLIVIDPIDKERNSAASLSLEKFNLMKDISRSFLENPHESFFYKEELSIEKLKQDAKKRKGEKLLILHVTPMKGKKDVAGAKLLKVFDYISRRFSEKDFTVKEKFWRWDKKDNCIMCFYLDSKELEKKKKHPGPPLSKKEHVEFFKQKHRETFQEGGNICAMVRRKYTKPEIFLEDLVREDYISEKVRKIKIIR